MAAIQPLECERSVTVAKGDRMDRWQRRLIEAAKQAHVPWLPVVEPSRELPQLLERAGEFAVRLVADTGMGERVQGSGFRVQETTDKKQRQGTAEEEKRRQGEEEQRQEGTGDRGQGTAGSGESMSANTAGVAPGVAAIARILAARFAPQDRLLVVIGPEGGFSDVEREVMRRAGLMAVSLGPTVLRTETATIVAAGCLLAAADAAGTNTAPRPTP